MNKKNSKNKKTDKKTNKKEYYAKSKDKKSKFEKIKKPKKKSLLNTNQSKIMHALKRNSEHEFASRELFRSSGIKDKNQFYQALKELKEMEMVFVKNHNIKINDIPSAVRGELFSLSKGFGFVRPEDGSEDIFIPGRALKEAMVGDKVLVSNIQKDSKGYSGFIERVLTEVPKNCTGTVVKNGEYFELVPDNKIRYNLYIKELGQAKVGDKVQVLMKQNSFGDWANAEVVKIFGNAESAKVCSDAIIEQALIPTEFSEIALKEARSIKRKGIHSEELEGRMDFRDKNIFTIDGKDAKDLDDAISLEKEGDNWILGVHIADVAHYVLEDTELDNNAKDRGTSVYFADRVIPMLPKEISNGTCSLTAGKDKLCFSAMITLSEDGEIRKYKFVKSVINSKVRGVYSEVNKIFENKATARLQKKYEPVLKDLENGEKLAAILEKRAYERGYMELDSDETQFVLDENGVCIDLKSRESGKAQKMIEQFMICANICAARYSKDNELPFLYRVHESPEVQNVKELIKMLKAFGIPCKELTKEKITSFDLNAIIEKVKDTKYYSVVSKKVLRIMEKAHYSTEATGHFGLALKHYSHFTSPIRRYPDTSIHRVLTAHLSGMNNKDIVKKYSNFCTQSAVKCSEYELRAVRAERQAQDCYVAEYMRAHIGEVFVGAVSSVMKTGVFIKLENSAEGFLRIENIKGGNFNFDGVMSMRSTTSDRVIGVGTQIEIIVASAQVSVGKVDFDFSRFI